MEATAPMTRTAHDFLPARISSVEQTGLHIVTLSDLALKIIYFSGVCTGNDIARSMRLPYTKVVERILGLLKQRHYVEVVGSSSIVSQNYQYNLTERGDRKVEELLKRSTYHGPCPVPLDQYVESVERQSLSNVTITLDQLLEAYKSLTIEKQILYQLGPAINSGTSIFLFGPPGNGKTTIAELAWRCMIDQVYIPHAIYAEGNYIQVFDELVHKPATGGEAASMDERWMRTQRPFVVGGGEITMSSLDLVWSEEARVYEAPLQMKANCGLLLIDDFGRQRITPAELLNRWTIPLVRKVDYLHLATGGTIRVPFHELIIFATNLEPQDLVDEAFLRRIRYKIMIPSPSLDQLREMFRRVAAEKKIAYRDDGFEYLVSAYYHTQGIEPRACHSRDLLEQIADLARFYRITPEMSPPLLELACQGYFVKT